MSSRRAAPVLALVILAMLVANAGVVVARSDDDGSALAAGAGAGAEVPDQLRATLVELEAFVEQTRGLRFKSAPDVELLDDEEFEDLLMGGDGTDGDGTDADGTEAGGEEAVAEEDPDADAFLGVMHALGLVEKDVDLDAVGDEQLDKVLGFYDSEEEALYVRGVELSPYAKMVLVHELTHALDDQHFDLDRPELEESDDDSTAAYEALVEGSATFVEQEWYDSRPQSESDAIDDAESEMSSGAEAAADEEAGEDEAPDVFSRLLAFPYAVGGPFVEAVVKAGGQARLDAAFAAPPVTTEQVLHPEAYLAGEQAARVGAPPAGGRVVDQGSLGELGLILVTGTSVGRNASLRASSGWAGDRYRAWVDGDRTCIRWDIRMDTPKDATELVTALKTWAVGHPGASVDGTDTVQVNSCR